MWEVDRKLWKTEDGKIVEDGDPKARVLFVVPGMYLPEDPLAKQAKTKAEAPAEDKAVKAPAEDKGKK